MTVKAVRHNSAEVRRFCFNLARPLWEAGLTVLWEDYRDDAVGVVGTRFRIADDQMSLTVTVSDAAVLMTRSHAALADRFAAHIFCQFEAAKVAA